MGVGEITQGEVLELLGRKHPRLHRNYTTDPFVRSLVNEYLQTRLLRENYINPLDRVYCLHSHVNTIAHLRGVGRMMQHSHDPAPSGPFQ